MQKKNRVSGYLQEILKITEGKECVYRGQSCSDWDLVSGAERRIEKSMRDFSDGEKLSVGNLTMHDYHARLLSKARQKGFDFDKGRKLNELELLAQLQHLGAATMLIDFSKQALVALYFACENYEDMDGKVFIVPYRNIRDTQMDESIKNIIDSKDTRCWYPTLHGPAERRIAAQSGLFLMNIRKDEGQHCIIKKEHKVDILKELRKNYQISVDTLFSDMPGFAQSQAHSVKIEADSARLYVANTLLGDLDD